MSQTKHQIEALLATAGARPLHRFGQNFMIDRNLVRLVADAGEIAPGDLVIEVGPGTGTLTEELLERGPMVLAVEIDRNLAALLRERFADRPQFTLIEGDALAGKHALNRELLQQIQSARSRGQRTRLVANLPYNIASPLTIELLLCGVDLLAFTVQKEVALRLRSKAGEEAYGPLSVVAQSLASVEVLRTLPPQAFWPAPTVESALVRLTRQDRLGEEAAAFGQFVHAVFSYRRKTLRKALGEAGYAAETILAQSGLDPRRRPEELTPEEFFQLYRLAHPPQGAET
jgi:16S rRNA (adenine1518-N6/adenine1519-N6)-dimethyltransferase